MGKIRGTHSSPGIYTQITDLPYAANSLGITTLGLVGETLDGRAFEPTLVSTWADYVQEFGGTSAEKFADSQYPRYELPYIAKSYLSVSDQLYVCRVLGLSGYNAGPAFVICAIDADGNKHAVAVLRSRGEYEKYGASGDICDPNRTVKYDSLSFYCDKIELEPYYDATMSFLCEEEHSMEQQQTIEIDASNYGRFTIICYKDNEEVGRYPVSFNAGTKEYVYNVLGTDPTKGFAKVFIEDLYDLNLEKLIADGATEIDKNPETVKELVYNVVSEPVSDFIKLSGMPEDGMLKRKHVGLTFLADKEGNDDNGFKYYSPDSNGGATTYALDDTTGSTTGSTDDFKPVQVGHIYRVEVRLIGDKKTYVYVPLLNEDKEEVVIGKIEPDTDFTNKVDTVKVLSIDSFVCLDDAITVRANGEQTETVKTVSSFSDYHEEFRHAITPWIVSEIKGDAANMEVKKLFRFHTISDGAGSNTKVKVSIQNISPDNGTFDVIIRDFNDSDANITVLESYKNLTMVPGTSRYIGLQIGTLDGAYELKSKYVYVEIIENDMTETCVPCGFLGYPTRDYGVTNDIAAPTLVYNTNYDEDIREKKQYFGISDITGLDVDMLTYKGKDAYNSDYTHGYTSAFHLDCRLGHKYRDAFSATTFVITLDGEENTDAIDWATVNPNNVTSEQIPPYITNEYDMEGSIYENKALRKFTVCFYGGFDGWDIYRKSRTATDEFKANKYKGLISNGYGKTFSKITDGDYLALEGNCITSDYYAFLAGANQFQIPEKYMINLFATPGIDYVNNAFLSSEILEMIEDKRKDTLYVMITPDKPWGASDAKDEMYTSAEAADNLEDSMFDTYYASTYYPWVKYFDKDNSKYIYLSPTKDVLRNMADVDNKKFPWYAPAGVERGNVECERMHFFAKLEDEDNVYDARINPLKTFSEDGVKIWGNKTMYSGNTPMNRINVVRLLLYMRKLISQAAIKLIFEPNDKTLKNQFTSIIEPILAQIKSDRGITDYRLDVSQTPEQMDAHELSAVIWIKPTPTLEYIEIEFVVTPQGVDFAN